MRLSRSSAATVVAAGLTLLAACAPSPTGASDEAMAVSGAPAAAPGSGLSTSSLLDRMPLALEDVAHSGSRVFEAHYVDGGRQIDLEYRESILTDGNGNFAIDPVAIIVSNGVPDPIFFALSKGREGFIRRYRDFDVRDRALFYRNHRVTETSDSVTVAGRACSEYRVDRVVGPNQGGWYDVAIDQATALMLRYREYDVQGTLQSSLEYESFDPTPDLTGAVWHAPSNQEFSLDGVRDLTTQLGFAPLIPTLAPDGYQLASTDRVVDASQNTWLKQTYTDGVETVFFLCAAPLKAVTVGAPTGLPTVDDSVIVHHIGRATVIQGEVHGHPVSVIGKVPEQELLDLLESSLP